MAKDPEKRAEEQERQIRERLNEAGGFGSKAMRMLDVFFSHYHQLPTPESFPEVLKVITDLQLMQLPEHRFGVAGGIAAVASLHPDLLPAWKRDYPVLVTSAIRLTPPIIDTDISSPGHIEHLFVWWLVTREAATLQRIVRLATREGPVGLMCQALLYDNVNLPEVKQVVDANHAKWSPLMNRQGFIDQKLQELANSLVGKPNVVCVGKQADGVIVCVTLDGSRPPGCPDAFICREPTREELKVYRAVLDQSEDP